MKRFEPSSVWAIKPVVKKPEYNSWYDGYKLVEDYLKSSRSKYTIIRKETTKSIVWYDKRYTYSCFKSDYEKMMTDKNTVKLTVFDNTEKRVVLRVYRNGGTVKIEVGSCIVI